MTAENRPPQMHSARVLTFRRSQPAARRPASGPVPDLAKYEHGHYGLDRGSDDYRHRMIVNLAAFVVVVALIFAGYWLADTMARMRKNQDCVLSGRRGCTPVTVVPQDRWQVPPDRRF